MFLSKRILSICSILWISIITSYGQKVFDKNLVSTLFPKSSKNLWIHTLEGTLDGVYPLQMILGTDGHQCKGYYRSVTDQEIYYFEGTDENHKVFLTEFREDGRPMAFISGSYDGQRLFGQWMDKSKVNKMKIDLQYVSSFTELKQPCEFLESAYYFEGKIFGSEYKMQLFIHDATAKYFIKSDTYHHLDILPIIKNGKQLTFDTKLDDQVVSFTLDSIDDQTIQISNTKESTSWKADSQLTFTCNAKLDYAVGYKYMTPIKNDKNFDKWITDKIKQISKSSENLNKIKEKRWQYNVDVWVEILFIDKNFIGGWIYAHDSRNPAPSKEAFIYDIDSHDAIKIETFFKDITKFHEVYNVYEGQYLSKQKSEKKDHFKATDFKYITLSNFGIAVSTNFNTVYGEGVFYIPYKECGQYLKEKYRYLEE